MKYHRIRKFSWQIPRNENKNKDCAFNCHPELRLATDLVVQNSHVAGDDLVLEDRAWRDVDSVSVVGDDDDGAAQRDAAPESDVAGHRQMVELDDVGNIRESAEELLHFAEVIVAELDERRRREHSLRRHDQRSVLQTVQIRHHEQQIRGLLDGQEARARHVDADGVLEALHRSTDGSLQLDHAHSVVQRLVVNDDLHVHALVVQHALDRVQLRPNVVGVEELERLHRLEVVDVLVRHLRDFQQSQLVLVLNQSSTLDVGPGFISDLHHELVAHAVLIVAHQPVQDAEVDRRAEIVDVGQEQILATLLDELLQQPRVLEGLVEVTVAGRVPGLHVVGHFVATRDRQQRVSRDSREAALVEAVNGDLEAGVLAHDLLGVFVGVERVHKHEGHTRAVSLI